MNAIQIQETYTSYSIFLNLFVLPQMLSEIYLALTMTWRLTRARLGEILKLLVNIVNLDIATYTPK